MPNPTTRRARNRLIDGGILPLLVLALLSGGWAACASGEPSTTAPSTASNQTNNDVAELNQSFPQSQLQIATPDARVHSFNIWLALDEPSRERGLMFVQHLPDDAGMLFVYTSPRIINMWMKNTLIPLDMIFIDRNGRVQHIAANAKPQSLSIIPSDGEAYAVLEVKGGTAKRLHIAPGAIITHKLFEPHTP